MTSLATFLRTGRWGRLSLPATRAAVREALGTPTDWMGPAPDRSPLWRCGALEAHFIGDQGDADDCWMIFCDNLDALFAQPSVDARLLPGGSATAQGGVEAALRGAGIGYGTRQDKHRGLLVVTGAGVNLQIWKGRLAALWLHSP